MMEVTTIEKFSSKDAYMLMLLHLNEDFDDDLFYDCIFLLEGWIVIYSSLNFTKALKLFFCMIISQGNLIAQFYEFKWLWKVLNNQRHNSF